MSQQGGGLTLLEALAKRLDPVTTTARHNIFDCFEIHHPRQLDRTETHIPNNR